jgi:hypothetical protein
MEGWQGNLVGDRCNYVLIVGKVKNECHTWHSLTEGDREIWFRYSYFFEVEGVKFQFDQRNFTSLLQM